MNKKITLVVICLILGVFFLQSQIVLAGSNKIYVDKDHNGDEKGIKDDPYKTIKKALESAGSGDEIHIENGTYKEDLTIGKGISLYGENKSKTIIENSGNGIVAEGDNHIEDLTISGGRDAITFEEDGEIESCYIKDAEKNAINLVTGKDKFVLTKSKIKNNAKGIYVQRGRKIEISNNEFSENSEEGIDVRGEVKGFIKNNSISNSGEGGIEIVLGGAEVVISNNIINKNGSSGIASQFYDFVSEVGSVKIQNNIISKNKKFGIRCGAPQGGDMKKGYWNESLQLDNNTIELNNLSAIDPACKLIKAVSEDEEENQKITEIKAVEEAVQEAVKAAEEERRLKEEAFLKEVEELKKETENFKSGSTNLVSQINNVGKFKKFLFGIEKEKIEELASLNEKQKKATYRLREIEAITYDESIEQIAVKIIEEADSIFQDNESFIADQSDSIGFFGWIRGLF